MSPIYTQEDIAKYDADKKTAWDEHEAAMRAFVDNQVDKMTFFLRGNGTVYLGSIRPDDFPKDAGYWAHAENSGSEGCYVEIARWNEKANRWEKYAFEKFFGGELIDYRDADAYQTCEIIADSINRKFHSTEVPIVANMPREGE